MSIIKLATGGVELLKGKRSAFAWAALFAAAAASGCGDVDTRPATWDYLSPAIFQPNCATTSCHTPASAVSGVDFSTPERGYTSLTGLWVWIVVAPDDGAPPAGVPCATVDGTLVCERQLRPLVTPYDPAGSRVVNMLRARDATRMPPDRPLTEPDIRLIERWISNGACASGISCNDAGATAQDGAPAGDAAADAAGDTTDAANDARAGN
jgi:hypothetical protein